MTNLDKRWITAKEFLANPSSIDAYPYKYLLLFDVSGDWSHQNLLMAVEQMEDRGWELRGTAMAGQGGMYALMGRKQ